MGTTKARVDRTRRVRHDEEVRGSARPASWGTPVALMAMGAVVCAACGPKVAAGSGSGSGSAGGETGATQPTASESAGSSATVGTSSSSGGPSPGGSSSSGGGASCPEPDPSVSGALATVYSNDWPDAGGVDAICDAVSVTASTGPTMIDLRCAYPPSGKMIELPLYIAAGVDVQMDGVVGQAGLRLSFYRPAPNECDGFGGCPYTGTASLRDADGNLILLSWRAFTSHLDVGDPLEAGRAGWLDPGSPDYEAWDAPFGDMAITNVGCAARPGVRPGDVTEVPLALQLDADSGPVSI